MTNNNEYPDLVNNVMGYFRRTGCLIRKTKEGFEWQHKIYPTIGELDEAIKQACGVIENAPINHVNKK